MKRAFVMSLCIFTLLVAIVGYGVYWAFFDMERLPEGEFLTEAVSPDGTYTVRAYKANGGATVAYSVRGELVFNNEEQQEKNIYWNYREESAVIFWVDDDTVEINGRQLTVPQETYDFRNRE